MTEPEVRAIVERIVTAVHTLGGTVQLMTLDGDEDGLAIAAVINQLPVEIYLPGGEHAYTDVARALLNRLSLPEFRLGETFAALPLRQRN